MARRALGADHAVTLVIAHMHAYASARTYHTQNELVFAEKLLEDTVRRLRRVLVIEAANCSLHDAARATDALLDAPAHAASTCVTRPS